jgi:magnesium-transporting ATPase (P-type)
VLGRLELGSAAEGLTDEDAEARRRTSGRNVFVLMQNYHAFNCRSETESAFAVPLGRNPLLAVGVLLAPGLHVLAMHVPFMQTVLRVAPVALAAWLAPLLAGVSILAVMEVFKASKRR